MKFLLTFALILSAFSTPIPLFEAPKSDNSIANFDLDLSTTPGTPCCTLINMKPAADADNYSCTWLSDNLGDTFTAGSPKFGKVLCTAYKNGVEIADLKGNKLKQSVKCLNTPTSEMLVKEWTNPKKCSE